MDKTNCIADARIAWRKADNAAQRLGIVATRTPSSANTEAWHAARMVAQDAYDVLTTHAVAEYRAAVAS